MAKILAFAGSNSSTSINHKLVSHTAKLMVGHDVRLLNMLNYPFPMYSEDLEREQGFSNSLIEFKNDIQGVNGLIISVNEHNGGLSAYFKNVLDWLSRLERKFLADKKVLLMASSPGKRGGIGALEYASTVLPRFGADEIITFSLPSFHENFDMTEGIVNVELREKHAIAVGKLRESL